MIKIALFVLLIALSGNAISASNEYDKAQSAALNALDKTDTAQRLKDKVEDQIARKVGTSKRGATVLGVGALAIATGHIDTEHIKGGWKLDEVTVRPDLEQNLHTRDTILKISLVWGF